jgi:hypothetical protein
MRLSVLLRARSMAAEDDRVVIAYLEGHVTRAANAGFEANF